MVGVVGVVRTVEGGGQDCSGVWSGQRGGCGQDMVVGVVRIVWWVWSG